MIKERKISNKKLLLIFLIIFFSLFYTIDSVRVHSKKPVVIEPPKPPRLTYVPQFVLISFDGSKSVDIWKNIRAFKNEMKGVGKSLNVTYFINAAYFLTQDTKYLYQGPTQKKGTSNIGFSDDIESLGQRINEVNMAVTDGDEIEPHTVGHFSGKLWTKEEWKKELAAFDRIMFGLSEMYSGKNLPKLKLTRDEIIGFRAPYLDKSRGLYEALHDLNFAYDTSEVGIDNTAWPTRDAQGLWRIPLGRLELGLAKSRVLAMDYNIYVHNSAAYDTIKKGSAEWKRVYDETLAGFLAYFNQNYTGTRAPVLVGYHFSMDWNDGVYWEVLKDFSREVCGKPEVRCGTFRELVKYMDEYGVPGK